MRKKQILVMGLVVLAILAMSFILVMMTTGREAYGKEQQHTCPTCKGEKKNTMSWQNSIKKWI